MSALIIGALVFSAAASPPVTTDGVTRQPRNIYELLYGVEYTFSNILTVKELALYRTGDPEEIRRNDPELYDRYNKVGKRFGRPLSEGITESATRQLVLDYELLPKKEIRKAKAYPVERKRIDFIIKQMMKKNPDLDKTQGLELLLEAYVTGNQEKMNELFGAEAWARIVGLSFSEEDWDTHRIRAAVENEDVEER